MLSHKHGSVCTLYHINKMWVRMPADSDRCMFVACRRRTDNKRNGRLRQQGRFAGLQLQAPRCTTAHVNYLSKTKRARCPTEKHQRSLTVISIQSLLTIIISQLKFCWMLLKIKWKVIENPLRTYVNYRENLLNFLQKNYCNFVMQRTLF